MTKPIIALLVGLALGYNWGYGDGIGRQGSIVTRTLDHFGATRIKQAQSARERNLQDAIKP